MLELISVYLDDMDEQWSKEEAPTLTAMLIAVMEGSVLYEVEGVPYKVEKGELLYLPQGVRRSGRNSPDGPHRKYSIHFHATPQLALQLSGPAGPCKIKTRQFEYIRQRFGVLARHWFEQRPYAPILCNGIAMELAGMFAEDRQQMNVASVKLRLIREMQAYIAVHYREPLRIADLAALVDRAPNYVTHLFTELTGTSPIAYLHQVRIHAARDLILNTRMTIAEVSAYLGYSDPSHFNRAFRRWMGYPPSACQRELKSGVKLPARP
ncbi:helix-turn-helix domain-containing protein [Paenibacillus daejeonensis]|uniref:helix-turn-helix domain-containing protein n=1 Tax=Paenibacillus daejeonensis TaxID=135193 RepID=UPI0003741F33|nr:AraC family transcriptional regulator [Paenibacillus daejeonensis]